METLKLIGVIIIAVGIGYLGHLHFKSMNEDERTCYEIHRYGQDLQAFNNCVKRAKADRKRNQRLQFSLPPSKVPQIRNAKPQKP